MIKTVIKDTHTPSALSKGSIKSILKRLKKMSCEFFSCHGPHPVHVKREEDLVHIAAGFLRHAVHFQHGLQLKQRDQSWRRFPHEFGVPVVHVLLQDVVQAGAVRTHDSCEGFCLSPCREAAARQGGGYRGRCESSTSEFQLKVMRKPAVIFKPKGEITL